MARSNIVTTEIVNAVKFACSSGQGLGLLHVCTKPIWNGFVRPYCCYADDIHRKQVLCRTAIAFKELPEVDSLHMDRDGVSLRRKKLAAPRERTVKLQEATQSLEVVAETSAVSCGGSHCLSPSPAAALSAWA